MTDPADLLPQVYDELRKLAAAKLAHEKPGQTLDATALVHEAYMRLVANSSPPVATGGLFTDRTHFLRAAATAMRRILVDRARAKLTEKRGGELHRRELPDIAAPLPDDRLVALDAALSRLAETKPDHAKLIELRYFAGLSGDEAADVLGISPSSADRIWRYARAWLQVEIQNN
jgi:RNA polymerase sigma factor (TIGR02999 family)